VVCHAAHFPRRFGQVVASAAVVVVRPAPAFASGLALESADFGAAAVVVVVVVAVVVVVVVVVVGVVVVVVVVAELRPSVAPSAVLSEVASAAASPAALQQRSYSRPCWNYY